MNINKWQQMLLLVNQNAELLETDLKGQYKKLFLKRWFASNLLVFLLQYIGFTLNLPTLTISPMWFFTGTACAFIFLQGYRILPGLWLGNFIAYYLAKASFLLALGSASVITLQALILF